MLFPLNCFCDTGFVPPPQLSQDEATTFYDELNHHIFELVSSSDVNEKKGGILAIGKPETLKYQFIKFTATFDLRKV